MLGLAVGDAVGTTLEFKTPGSFNPIDDMVGGGPYRLNPGEWTDDTSMALCLATSLVEKGRFDPEDQMDRYCDWKENGYLSSTGRCFDIGKTVSQSLLEYQRSGDPFSGPTDPMMAGNGSLMRLGPVVLFYHPNREDALNYAAESSRTTHGAQECLDACEMMAELLLRALAGQSKEEVLTPIERELCSATLQSISQMSFRSKSRSDIRASGYVVHCLEAALWCFSRTNSFRDAVLMAANLGEDADTTAAVCGQLAGAHYGAEAIPEPWLGKLVMREEIADLADKLRSSSGTHNLDSSYDRNVTPPG